jgi:ABC-type multidrug transport system fused ATPase/permease subunit
MAQKFTDDRLKLTGETIAGINVFKCYAWEGVFLDKVNKIRKAELAQFRVFALLRACFFFLVSAVPVLVAVASFAVYTWKTGETLSAGDAFTSLNLFNILRFPLLQLPSMVNQFTQCKLALNRIREFLLMEELPPLQPAITHSPTSESIIEMKSEEFQEVWYRQH